MGRNGLISKIQRANPEADFAALTLPGHDGGKWGPYRGPGSYGFYAIPSSIKSEARIKELLHILDWWAAPFGSDEYTFIVYGLEGPMYQRVDGAPVPTTDTAALAMSSGINYMIQPLEINFYYPGNPDQAKLAQTMQEQMIQLGVDDPTLGLYSPTDVSQGGNLHKLIQDTYNSIVVGRKPLSALSDLIGSWKSGGGAQSRKEFQQALQKCHS
jgi:putative aldouronate transport system substrate-binding protein